MKAADAAGEGHERNLLRASAPPRERTFFLLLSRVRPLHGPAQRRMARRFDECRLAKAGRVRPFRDRRGSPFATTHSPDAAIDIRSLWHPRSKTAGFNRPAGNKYV